MLPQQITTFNYAESRVNSINLDYLTRRASISNINNNRSIDVSNNTNKYTNILVNSYSYSTTSFDIFSSFLRLYYLLHIGLYSFYFTRYLIVIL